MSSSTEKPILLLAKTGFIIRNLLLGTFADLIMRERPLVVAVPNPSDEKLKDIFKGRPIRFVPFPEEPERDLSRTGKLKLAQTYMYRFRQAEKANESLKIQTRLFESKHSFLADVFFNGIVALGHVIKQAGLMGRVENIYLDHISRWPVTQEWEQLIEEIRPAALISTMLTHSLMYNVSCDLPAVLAAKKRGIPAATLVQSWDNISSKTSVLPPWLDQYWVWSDEMAAELLQMNPRIPPAKVKFIGSPQFDFHRDPEILEARETFMRRAGLDPERPYIVIGAGTAAWFPGEPAQTAHLIKAFRDRHGEKVQILIRLHPKDNGLRWKDIRPQLENMGVIFQATAPSLHMDLGGFSSPKEFYRDQVNTLAYSELVINTSSTLTVDAAILDKPVICIAYDAFPDPKFPEGRCLAYSRSTHYSRLVKTGGVTMAHSVEECLQAIEKYLKDPSLEKRGRQKILETVTQTADGQAGARLAQNVLHLANGREPK